MKALQCWLVSNQRLRHPGMSWLTWVADMRDREFPPFSCTSCFSLCQHLRKWASSQQPPVRNKPSASLCWLLVRDIRLVSLSIGASGKMWRLASLKDWRADSRGSNKTELP